MADNDNKFLQKMKYFIRKSLYEISYKNLLSDADSANAIKEMVRSGEPFMICRLGAEESRTAVRWANGKPYQKRNYDRIKSAAGVFPNDEQSIDNFSKIYTDAISKSDGVFTWGCVGEKMLINKYCKSNTILLRDSANYFFFNEILWTSELEGKKVLVIHPFIDTINEQYKKRALLFERKVLPEFNTLLFLKTVQSNAGNAETCGFLSWTDALEYMKKEISKMDFDIALIAGGAYGIPLAAHVKDIGKQAIHIASNLQILFGIRGKRWDNWPDWARYFNEYWVYPSEKETPIGKSIVEGGSYWK